MSHQAQIMVSRFMMAAKTSLCLVLVKKNSKQMSSQRLSAKNIAMPHAPSSSNTALKRTVKSCAFAARLAPR